MLTERYIWRRLRLIVSFHFSNRLSAEIAVDTVRQYRGGTEVIFKVFKDVDYEIYRELLG